MKAFSAELKQPGNGFSYFPEMAFRVKPGKKEE
jgi:hypothetical protein